MQRALIVDDSRTARVALRQMLVRHHFAVEMVDSAESALEYLRGDRPDLIFMDHLMPGMDGFQALRAIKSDPACAGIPIVMYTSKEGDVYVGQARALGAIDILTKPARNEELAQVLERVHNHGQAADVQPTVEVIAVSRDIAPVEAPAAHGLEDEPPMREPTGAVTAVQPEDLPATGARGRPRFAWLAWGAATCLALLLAAQAYRQHQMRMVHWQDLAWAVNQRAQYGLGELPLGDERLELLEGLVKRLKASGFRGAIRLEGHAGDYCLVRGADSRSLVLPPPQLPRSRCDRVGLSEDDARWLSVAQSPGFKEFLRSSPLLADGRIAVEIVGLGRSQGLMSYPAITPDVTAGEWNEVARLNSRVEVVLYPAAGF